MEEISDTVAAEIAAQSLEKLAGKVAVVGSLNADITIETQRHPMPGETVIGGELRVLPGGKSANQAVASAKLGMEVQMIGCLGQDSYADILLRSLHDAGVDTEYIKTVNNVSTGAAVITVDAAGENSIVISAGANGEVTTEVVQSAEDAITSAQVLGLCFEIPMDAVVEAAKLAKSAGVLVVLNYSPITQAPSSLLSNVDVLIVNEHELSAIVGHSIEVADTRQLTDALAAVEVDRVVVTLGADGSMVWDYGRVTRVPSFKVTAVDTTGAGDCFMAGLLSALASGLPLVEAAIMASAASAVSATSFGAQASYRTRSQIQEFLASRQNCSTE